MKPKTKWILGSMSALGIGLISIAGYSNWKKKQKAKTIDFSESSGTDELPIQTVVPKTTSSVKRNDDFPLKMGSKGENVRKLQEYLIAKHGKSILPKYGADGDFGNETKAALLKASLPTSIDKSTFDSLFTSAASLDPKEIARVLFLAVVNKNLSQVLFTLKGLNSTKDYEKVSLEFKKYRIGGVRKTLVTGLLDAFSSLSDKEKIREEFSRIGLKYDGQKWSLSGLLITPSVVALSPTYAYNASLEKNDFFKKGDVLGEYHHQKEGWVFFKTDRGKLLKVRAKNILIQ